MRNRTLAGHGKHDGKARVPSLCRTLFFIAAASALPVRALDLLPGRTEVVLAPDAPGTTAFAAAELTNFLARALGSDVPVVRRPTEGRASVVLGANAWSSAAGISTNGLPRDAFRIRARDSAICIAGVDADVDLAGLVARGARTTPPCGTLYGAYEFLERFAGVRFYFPGEIGTVVPCTGRIEVPACDLEVAPAFLYRDCYVAAAGIWPVERTGAAPVPEKETRRLKALYSLRLRERLDRPRCCHGQNRFGIAERFSETHPEYFMQRRDGTRCTGTKFEHHWQGRQLCHTSPVWDVIREETLARVRRGERSVDIMPQDGMQPCMCPTCQARFNTTNFSLSSGYATELIWSNTVAVARAITAAGLDGAVAQMAYGTYRDLPSFDIPDNVNLVLAVGGPWSESHPEIRDRQVDFVRGWAGKLGRKVSWIWTYPMKNYGRLMAPDVPQHAPHAYLSFYRRVAPYIEGTFVESNCASGEELHLIHNYLNFYLFSKFAWNHGFDLDAALAEHHRLMFGGGADDMAAFFDLLERKWIGEVAIPSVIGETEIGPVMYCGPSGIDLWTKIYAPDVLDRLRGCLDRATAGAAGDGMSLRRIDWIRAGFFDPLAARAGAATRGLSVAREQERRAKSPATNVVEGLKFSLPRNASVDRAVCVTTNGAVRIDADGRTYVGCSLKGRIKPNTRYRLSYYIRVDGLVARAGRGARAEYEEYTPKYVAVPCPKGATWDGTRDWIHQSVEFTSGPEAGLPACRPNLWLRVYDGKGTVWFDGLRLEEI